LDEAISATRNMIEDALACRRDGSFAIKPAVEQLAGTLALLDAPRKGIRPVEGG
jgi:hypothetical protein